MLRLKHVLEEPGMTERLFQIRAFFSFTLLALALTKWAHLLSLLPIDVTAERLPGYIHENF